MKKCLFLIDVQYGFVSDETEYVLERIDSLINSGTFDYVIASKFINIENSPYMKFLNWMQLVNDEETRVYEPVSERADIIIEKNIYTAITQDVIEFLKTNKIEKIFLAGIDTDCCVLKTAVDFFEIGIKSFVLEHYSASNGGKVSHEAALTVLKRLIGEDSIIVGDIRENKCNLDITNF